ncbi:alpha-1-antitrypsin-like [Pleurodeles waltl]|uniref:alpha-1-antitrypsin-like n=1 Tax=Pleurodeles waltl TaxID=8319 RepID=UPI0037095B86
MISASLRFAFDIYKHSASRCPSKNFFFSPLSISTAFAMLSEGAKSKTREQIIEALGFNLTDIEEEEINKGFEHLILSLPKNESKLSVTLGNVVFLKDKLKLLETFKGAAKHHYQAEILTSNFDSPEDATNQINDYVEKHTNGKIVDLVDSLEENTNVVLVNYIFFKGKWKHPFNALETSTEKFFVNENTTVEVPMMIQTKYFNAVFDEELPCTVVNLPYKGNAYMKLVLPNPRKMKEVEDALSANTFTRWIHQSNLRLVELSLPKISIAASFPLKDTLQEMGMTDVFTDHSGLSRIAEGVSLKLAKAVHKAFLSVDEEGTEAAAATLEEGVPTTIITEANFNRPFLLFICSQEDHHIFFMGRVENPLEK